MKVAHRGLSMIVVPIILFVFSACSTKYVTPGKAVDFTAFTEPNVKKSFEAKPAVTFPAAVVLVRVQGPEYRNNAVSGYGSGRYTVITTREVENEKDLDNLKKLPGLDELGSLNRLLLPEQLSSDLELREAAGRLRADLLLLYTFSTYFRDEDLLPPLSLISLGLAPTQSYKVTSTASAILIDVKTGFVYGALEESEAQSGIATAWTDAARMEGARLKAEREAFDKLLSSFEPLWLRVYERYGKPTS